MYSKKVPLLVMFTCIHICLSPFTWSHKSDRENFQFNWKAPAELIVIDRMEKKGKKATIQFKIIYEKQSGKNQYRLSFKNVEFLEIDGTKITDDMKKEMRDVIAQEKLYADFIVNENGVFIELIELDKTLDVYARLLKKYMKDPEKIKEIDKIISSKAIKDFIRNLVHNIWMIWVESWISLDFKGRSKIEGEIEETVLSRFAPIKMVYTIEQLGKSNQYPDGIHIRSVRVPEKTALSKFKADFLARLSGKKVTELKPDDINKIDISIKTRSEVVFTPGSMETLWAFWERKVHLLAPGFGEKKEYESHEYQFKWKR